MVWGKIGCSVHVLPRCTRLPPSSSAKDVNMVLPRLTIIVPSGLLFYNLVLLVAWPISTPPHETRT